MPDNKTIVVRPGTTVLDAARRARVSVRTRCGGNASCLLCKVRIDDASSKVSKANEKERLKLGSRLEEGLRLACQTRVFGDTDVDVLDDPLKAAVRAQLDAMRKEDSEK